MKTKPERKPSPLGARIAALLAAREFKDTELDQGIALLLKRKPSPGWTHKVTHGLIQHPRGPHLEAAAKVLGVDVRHLLTGEGPALHRELDGWTEAAAHPGIPFGEWVVEAVAGAPVMVAPEHVTAEFVEKACAYWLSVASPEARRRAVKAEVGRQEKRSSRGSRG